MHKPRGFRFQATWKRGALKRGFDAETRATNFDVETRATNQARAPDGPRSPKEADARARDAVMHGVSATVVPASIRPSGQKKENLSHGRAEISPPAAEKLSHVTRARARRHRHATAGNALRARGGVLVIKSSPNLPESFMPNVSRRREIMRR